MKARELAEAALARLPRPYGDDVVLHVFREIERTPELLKAYYALAQREYTDEVPLNRAISRRVAFVLGARKGSHMPADSCGLFERGARISRLEGINQD